MTPSSSFCTLIRCEYGVELPFLFKGTLEEAKTAALTETKYFILCLYTRLHEDSNHFFSKVLLDDEIIAQFLERSIFYGACVDEAEGMKLAEQYEVQAFPSLIVFFKNEVAMELGGELSAATVKREWRKCTDVWDSLVAEEVSFKADQMQRRLEIEMEEQRLAELEMEDKRRLEEFEAQRREKEKKEEERRRLEALRREEEEAAAREAARKEQEEREKEERAAQEKLESQSLLSAEPVEEDVAGGSAIALRFRFPKGQQLTRRFRRADCVDQMNYFVRSLEFYDGASMVQFVTGYPPKPVEWEAGVTIFDEVKQLSSNSVINVRLVK